MIATCRNRRLTRYESKTKAAVSQKVVKSHFCFASFDLLSQPSSNLCGALVLKAWAVKQQHQQHLGTFRNASFQTVPRPTESETPKVGSAICVSTRPQGDFDAS